MGEDKATREKLLESAKHEFLEKGYMKASLRTICKNAGVTTGALYFFFEDKEDLLKSLAKEPLNGLFELIKCHFFEETEENTAYAGAKDIEAAKEIVKYLYRHYDIFLILLTKSQGSCYEDLVSRIVDLTEAHYKAMSADIAASCGVRFSEYMFHWSAHTQINAFVHLLLHETDVSKAVREIEQICAYLIAGWNGMISQGNKNNNI